MKALLAFFSLLAFLLMAAATAQALEIKGALTQGGLVVGRVDPGSMVAIDGRNIRVSKDGFFLIGFARDAPGAAKLMVTKPDGESQSSILKVAKRSYGVQRIDGLPQRQVTPKPADLQRIKADNAAIEAVRKRYTDQPYFASGFIWPVLGQISGVYGSQRILNGNPKQPHHGVDIKAPLGEAVNAAADGVVALVRQDMFYTGKTMMIDHGHGLISVYAHMNETLVKEGQLVAKGQAVGKIGATGRATGPHLHWGVALEKTQLDPALLVEAMAESLALPPQQ